MLVSGESHFERVGSLMTDPDPTSLWTLLLRKFVNAEDWEYSLVTLLLALSVIGVVLVLRQLRLRRRSLELREHVDHVNSRGEQAFDRVSIRYGVEFSATGSGVLRSISPNRATIFWNATELHRGSLIELDLSHLPSLVSLDRKSGLSSIKGRIVRVQPVGSEDNWLVNVSFLEKNAIPRELLQRPQVLHNSLLTPTVSSRQIGSEATSLRLGN